VLHKVLLEAAAQELLLAGAATGLQLCSLLQAGGHSAFL
jgi:hypothetical protein